MTTAKLFTNGGSQAVRLPKEYRFEGTEVMINKIGNTVVLFPKDEPWEATIEALALFTDDCLTTPPEDLPLQEREW